MKEFYERILGDEILFAEEFCSWEFALVDITADSSDILVQKFSDFFYCVEVDFDGHLKRTPSIFSRMNTTLFDDAPDLIGGDINPASYLDDILDDLVLSPVMECDNTYAEKLAEFLGSEDVIGFRSHFSPMNFLILYRVLSWGFDVLPLRISATAECDIFRYMAIC